jgi:hypothetical protein
MQVQKLVAPLRQDPERILKKSDDDQKPAQGWEISAVKNT